MKQKIAKYWIYVIAISISIISIIKFRVVTFPDTPTYIHAWENALSHGTIDSFRTPVYPIFIGICEMLSSQHYMFLCIVLQYIVFIISIYYFEKVASFFIPSCKLLKLITLIYAILPNTCSWGNCILTECFAITGVVFFIYTFMNWYKYQKKSSAWWNIFWLFFLVFLRPAFLYLLPTSLVIWLYAIVKKLSHARIGLMGTILVCLLDLCYCFNIKQQTGVFTPSTVSVVNTFYTGLEDNLIKPEYFEDETTRENFTMFISKKRRINGWLDIGDYDALTRQKAIEKSRAEQPLMWIKCAIHRCYRSAKYFFIDSSVWPYIGPISYISGLYLTHLYLFVFAYFIIFAYACYKSKKIYLASLFLLFIIFSHIFTTSVGAMAEWTRLDAPVYSIFLILFGHCLYFLEFRRSPKSRNVLL